MWSPEASKILQMANIRTYKLYFSYLWTYDLYGPVCNVFDAGKSITMPKKVETFMAQPFQWPL